MKRLFQTKLMSHSACFPVTFTNTVQYMFPFSHHHTMLLLSAEEFHNFLKQPVNFEASKQSRIKRQLLLNRDNIMPNNRYLKCNALVLSFFLNTPTPGDRKNGSKVLRKRHTGTHVCAPFPKLPSVISLIRIWDNAWLGSLKGCRGRHTWWRRASVHGKSTSHHDVMRLAAVGQMNDDGDDCRV